MNLKYNENIVEISIVLNGTQIRFNVPTTVAHIFTGEASMALKCFEVVDHNKTCIVLAENEDGARSVVEKKILNPLYVREINPRNELNDTRIADMIKRYQERASVPVVALTTELNPTYDFFSSYLKIR